MHIQSIEIHNYKGIEDLTVFPDHVTAFCGKCGAGKTSALEAVRFCLCNNKTTADIIKEGATEASVAVTFQDGSVIEKIRKKSSTEVRVNGNKTTATSAVQYLEDKFHINLKQLDYFLSIDYIEALNQKDITALFLSLLPVSISTDTVLKMITSLEGRELTDEETAIIKSALPDGKFGLEEIDQAHKIFSDARKEQKVRVKTLESRSAFDLTAMPSEPKQSLEKRLYELAVQDAKAAAYERDKRNYEMTLQNRKQAEERLAYLKQTLKNFPDFTPDTAVRLQAEDDKRKFEAAIRKHLALKATLISNVSMYEKILEQLSSPICPISGKLVCTTDKTVVKADIATMIEQNRAGVSEHDAFIARCQEQINKRNNIITEFDQSMMLYQQRKSTEEQIAHFILPTIPEAPAQVMPADAEEKAEINRKLSVIAAFETAKKYKDEWDAAEKQLALLEFAVKNTDIKTGVRPLILQRALKPLTEACEEATQRLDGDFSIKFECSNGLEVYVAPKDGSEYIPMNQVSTGEFVYVTFVILSAINAITNTRMMVIDSFDKLDEGKAETLVSALTKDTSFDHILIASVNHMDTVNALSKSGAQIVTM